MITLFKNTVRGHASIMQYQKLHPVLYRKIRALAKTLRGMTVIHVNATTQGGGVAELLNSQILIERSLGLDSQWYAIEAEPNFFAVTKKIHNLLQGKEGELTTAEKKIYAQTNEALGHRLALICKRRLPGVIVIHDPQPLAVIDYIPSAWRTYIRLHIDLLTPNPDVVNFFQPFIKRYDRLVLSSKAYQAAFTEISPRKIQIIMPAIDAFAPKNQPLSLAAAHAIISTFGINTTKPLMTQVSRFDPWKDPMGVIQAYYLAKKQIPQLQLALAGLMVAQDDPEAISVFTRVQKHAHGDPDIFLFSDPRQLKPFTNDVFISALYTASTVMMQKSIREGFGLTMTEAMWKGKPLIAGNTTGALMQIKHNRTGIIVDSPESAATALVALIGNATLRHRLGAAAKKSVQQKFLFNRYIFDHVKLYRK